MNLSQFIDEKMKEFREKFVKAPDYHDPNTHGNYPAEYKARMTKEGILLEMSDVEDFLRQAMLDLAEEKNLKK